EGTARGLQGDRQLARLMRFPPAIAVIGASGGSPYPITEVPGAARHDCAAAICRRSMAGPDGYSLRIAW
ncbi:hypothetical protein, partial [Stenotrophomonas maltophilia]|uniref:hypothetical protein n=1 Tax=Stenotrophomonas maltophilia TaxID=40324 RepID=UPI001953E8A9